MSDAYAVPPLRCRHADPAPTNVRAGDSDLQACLLQMGGFPLSQLVAREEKFGVCVA
jgi:hypothetical protein